MQTIDVIPGQTIIDIAVQEYGTIEAVSELIELNDLNDFSLTDPLSQETLKVNPDSDLVKQAMVRDLNGTKIIS